MPGASSSSPGTDSVPHREPLLAWPGWGHLGYFAYVGGLLSVWFWFVYGGADYITAQRDLRVRIHFDAEERIPFVPEAVVVYLSVFVLMYASPFILRARRELRALATTLSFVILCAGIVFLLLPADLGFPPHDDFGATASLFRLADWLNLDYNLVPSLHVAMSVVCIGAFSSRVGPTGKRLLWAWGLAIAISTLLTHQHHVVDVVSGLALGAGAVVLVYRRL